MATVYLARDVRHDRLVALKVLRPELGAMLGTERFLSEIRVTANLQHPHLLPLFDSGEADGLLYYVMPYVEGESLRGRLDRERQLPVDEALRLTVAVASALDYAHRQNVVHRDLKPENILLHERQPVVSDFGIALAVSKAGGARVTQTGLSLGTPQYMSPEQAAGDRLIDARSDIYALAAVLYEMLTGEPPHTGLTVQAIVARVLTERPRSIRGSRDAVPEHVDAAVQKALAKLPADRFATAQEFADALQDPRALRTRDYSLAEESAAGIRGRAAGWRARVSGFTPWIVTAAAVAAAGWFGFGRPAETEIPEYRFTLSPPPGVVPSDATISSTGTTVVFQGSTAGGSMLYARELGLAEAREIPGTQGASFPFLSPDGAALGFFADGQIRRVPLTSNGGAQAAVATTVRFGGASWGPDDVIVYSRGVLEGLWRVPATGGQPLRLTSLDTAAGEIAHILPHFLPDGRRVFFTIITGVGEGTLAMVNLDGVVRKLGHQGFAPAYVSTGHVLFNTPGGSVMAAQFDARREVISGEPVLLLVRVRVVPPSRGLWAVSRNGTLLFNGGGDSRSRLVLVDRRGNVRPLLDEAHVFRMPRVSPDGNRIAVEVSASGSIGDQDIWIFDRRNETLTRFTSGGGHSDVVWAADGRRLAFAGASGPGGVDIYVQPLDGSAAREAVLASPGRQWPWSWSGDGGTLVYEEVTGTRPTRIMALDLGSGATRPLVESEYVNRLGRLSPDGRWLAYVSAESGGAEVYVRTFPGGTGKTQVSTRGGDQPSWSRDGRELFYREAGGIMAAAVSDAAELTVLSRTRLFADAFEMSNATNYDVTADGQFVMLQPVDTTSQIVVMTGALRRLLRH
jgi:eukaryotic-like serine/threonine-protein kinase